MRKTKQNQIEHLEQSLNDERERTKKAENMLYLIREMLWGNMAYNHKFDDISDEIRRLKDEVIGFNTTVDIQNDMLRRENMRYWNLIRSLVGDKTLVLEMERKDINCEAGPLI